MLTGLASSFAGSAASSTAGVSVVAAASVAGVSWDDDKRVFNKDAIDHVPQPWALRPSGLPAIRSHKLKNGKRGNGAREKTYDGRFFNLGGLDGGGSLWGGSSLGLLILDGGNGSGGLWSRHYCEKVESELKR